MVAGTVERLTSSLRKRQVSDPSIPDGPLALEEVTALAVEIDVDDDVDVCDVPPADPDGLHVRSQSDDVGTDPYCQVGERCRQKAGECSVLGDDSADDGSTVLA